MYSRYEDEEETRAPAGPRLVAPQTAAAESSAKGKGEKDEPLPLPGWLLKLYFIFPVILYVPDAIFNYFVYSDGVTIPQTDNVFLQASQIALWGFLSIGVVGMAYLLSMLAPWHWMRGGKVQAFFCAIGVIIATGITIWNSLAYRSEGFHPFATDQWVYQIWPELAAQHISLTMIFAAVAPPFWGLFWAIVQPIQTKRNLSHLAESHAERMMRMQQEAEVKTMRAEANAKIRAAQLKGMAATATAAREQAGVVAAGWRGKKPGDEAQPAPAARPAAGSTAPAAVEEAPDTGIRLQPLPQDYSLPGSVAPRPRPARPAPRAAADADDDRPVVGRPVSREPGVADPIAAQGMQPAEVTDPMDRLARASATLQPRSTADVPPARTRGRARAGSAE
jgi:hypothetical protein